VELGMNIVLPATLILDWWDELLRVAGSLKLGWVTASMVIANKGHLRYRRGEALAHQACCLNLVTNAVIVSKTAYMAAAVEQLNAFFRRSVVRCLGEAWESAWAIEFIPIIATG
jgi:TnpA family transposase